MSTETVIRDAHDILFPANLWLTEDVTSGGELPLGPISSALDLESALIEVEQQGGTAGWYVSGADAAGRIVRLSTMGD
jgi:hypothetical protein